MKLLLHPRFQLGPKKTDKADLVSATKERKVRLQCDVVSVTRDALGARSRVLSMAPSDALVEHYGRH